MRFPLLALIRLYRTLLSPLLPVACRFTPTCSEYAEAAVAGHGWVKGGWLAIKRILRCHPWGSCGFDPPPTTCEGHTHEE